MYGWRAVNGSDLPAFQHLSLQASSQILPPTWLPASWRLSPSARPAAVPRSPAGSDRALERDDLVAGGVEPLPSLRRILITSRCRKLTLLCMQPVRLSSPVVFVQSSTPAMSWADAPLTP